MTQTKENPSAELAYPVLTPIKFHGEYIKPPCFIQLSAEEAAPLIADGYLGEEAALPPDDSDDATATVVRHIVTVTSSDPAEKPMTVTKTAKVTKKAKA